MYMSLNQHYREKFGCKVYKLSLDGGFTCPNRDGTLGYGGCIFCSGKGSGDFAELKQGSIEEQLEKAKLKVASKNKGGKYIAYFQSFSNTYAKCDKLQKLFLEAIKPDYIVGLAIGTRPDCIDKEKSEMLSRVNKIKPVSVELGLQTVHEKTAEYIRRGYKTEVYFEAVKLLKSYGIEVVTHIIIGLPGEDTEMIAETVKQVVNAGSDGVKFHLLHIIRGTDLEKEYLRGKIKCLTLEEYAEILKKCISLLPKDTVVHRITGDGAKKDLIAPMWSADKKNVLNFLHKFLEQ
ncbi:MAG: TIGR01212 family radical SAM protein [Ruminococcaceae bacterium]|nr:TIGR01212 family radical SAM protein [Oscillospiraceae bacterium]